MSNIYKKPFIFFLLGVLATFIFLVAIGVLSWLRFRQQVDQINGISKELVQQRASIIVDSIILGAAPLTISVLPEEEKMNANHVFENLKNKARHFNEKDIQDIEQAFSEFSEKMKTSSSDTHVLVARHLVKECDKISNRH